LRNTQEGEVADLQELAQRRWGIALPAELCPSAGSVTPHEGGARDRFRAVVPVARCFARLSHERPLVLVLDDVQWADEAARDIIGYLMRTLQSDPLLLLILSRAEEAERSTHPLGAWLGRQAGYRSFTTLGLRPFDEGHCRLAIEAALGGDPIVPPGDVRTLRRLTGGNPYFLMETLRLLVTQGAAARDAQCPQRWRWNGLADLQLPDSLVMAARARLERLPMAVRDVVETAAVIGDEFRVETLARTLEQEEAEVDDRLAEGVALGVLSRRGLSPGEDLRFHHTILRRLLYDGLDRRRRQRLHGAAARALEQVYAREPERVAAAVSAHLEAAQDPRGTFDWALQAWRAARSRWQWPEAVENIERARRAAAELVRLQLTPITAAEEKELLLGLGESYACVGRLREAETLLGEAVDVAETTSDQKLLATALVLRAEARSSLSAYREALLDAERAAPLLEALGDGEGATRALLQHAAVQAAMGLYEETAVRTSDMLRALPAVSATSAMACGVLGWSLALQGRFADGAPLLAEAAAYHERQGDLRRHALLLRRRHWVQLSRGCYEEAIQLAQRAREEYRRADDVSGEARTTMGIGQARIAQGLYAEGLVYLERALQAAGSIGAAHCEAETLWLQGRAHAQLGACDRADALLERALLMIRRIGDRDDEFRVLTDRARVRLLRGAAAEAAALADEAIRIAGELRNRDSLGCALVEQARALLRLGNPTAARSAAQRAVELLEQTGSGERWSAHWVLAQALEASGTPAAAEARLAELERAVFLLAEIRDQIDAGDGARRGGFIQARSGPAADLHRLLLQRKEQDRAAALSRSWTLESVPAAVRAH
jgi:tetratricopeptide (TPR) repeat protein